MFKQFIFNDEKGDRCGVCTTENGRVSLGIIGYEGFTINKEQALVIASILNRFAATGEVEPIGVEYEKELYPSAQYYISKNKGGK